MKVKDLIKKLSKFDKDKEVYMVTENSDGCETCGYGASINEDESFEIKDMETKIWLTRY